jgi:hypothetical protein
MWLWLIGAFIQFSEGSKMSFDKVLRQLIQEEIRTAIGPLTSAIGELQQNNVASQLAALFNGTVPGVKRGPGRPRKVALLGRAPAARAAKPMTVRADSDRACAVISCRRPMRSKGYCAAHYQKLRMLTKTRRLPADWKADAKPQTVKDLVLPRGRAGAKALAAANKK